MENDEDTGIYISEKQVYEVNCVRRPEEGGDESGGEVIECENDDDAIALARSFSQQWRRGVRLYRVPFVNTTSVHSINLWPDQYKLVADIPAPAQAFDKAGKQDTE